MSQTSPYSLMLHHFSKAINVTDFDLILHTPTGPKTVEQIQTHTNHPYVFVRDDQGSLSCYHLNVISGFELEARPTKEKSEASSRKLGFIATPDNDGEIFRT